MRVVLDLTPSVQGHAGMGRYAEELARALLASCPPDETLEVFFSNPKPVRPAPTMDSLPAKTLGSSNKAWRLSVMLAYALHRPQDTIVGRPDVFLATDHLLPCIKGAATLFTLHDVTFLSHPHVHTRLNRTYLRLLMPRFLQAADVVVADSRCTLQDALAHYPFISEKCHVVYAGVNSRFQPVEDPATLDALRARYNLPSRFLLYVGTIEPRKNLPTLLDAFARARLDGVDLVIAGKKGWLYDATLAQAEALGLQHKVMFLGFVPDDDLPALYNLAEAFTFPSLYEGFGLPVLEAMACGTPVVCANTSSLPEVAGDAALLLAPSDVAGWADALQRVTGEPDLRAELRGCGFRQAARFTWEATAASLRALYREAWARRIRSA